MRAALGAKFEPIRYSLQGNVVNTNTRFAHPLLGDGWLSASGKFYAVDGYTLQVHPAQSPLRERHRDGKRRRAEHRGAAGGRTPLRVGSPLPRGPSRGEVSGREGVSTASPSELSASPSEFLASPRELSASPSELSASPSELSV